MGVGKAENAIKQKNRRPWSSALHKFQKAEGTGLEVNCARFLPLIYVPHTAQSTPPR